MNEFGDETPSPAATVMTIGVPKQPEKPNLVWVQIERACISWKASKTIGLSKLDLEGIEYDVQISTGDKDRFVKVNFPFITSKKGKQFEMILSNLIAATSYSIRVVSRNKQGPSLPSKVLSVKTFDGIPEKVNQPALAGCTPTSIEILWKYQPKNKYPKAPQEPDVPLVFNLEHDCNSKGKKWTKVDINPTPVPKKQFRVNVTSLEIGKMYQFRVSASNRFGTGKISNIAKASTIGAPVRPDKPSALLVTHFSISLKWSEPKVIGETPKRQGKEDDPISYTIEHDFGSKGIVWVKHPSTKKLVTIVEALLPKTTYQIRLMATNKQGDSQVSSTISVKTKDTPKKKEEKKEILGRVFKRFKCYWLSSILCFPIGIRNNSKQSKEKREKKEILRRVFKYFKCY